MGLFDLFKSGPTKNGIINQVRKAKERYAQPDYRRMAMDKLLKWDTDESLKGLLERFCVVVQSPHWDEEEKRWLVGEVVKIGERMKPILQEFILEKNDVNHALEAYKEIVQDEKEYAKMLCDALNARPPSDHRSVQSKQEIISALAEINDMDLNPLLRPHLQDHSDDVQCASIHALRETKDQETIGALIEMLGSGVVSARVQRAAANLVCQRKFPLAENTVLSDSVKEDFRIDQGLLVRLNSESSAE